MIKFTLEDIKHLIFYSERYYLDTTTSSKFIEAIINLFKSEIQFFTTVSDELSIKSNKEFGMIIQKLSDISEIKDKQVLYDFLSPFTSSEPDQFLFTNKGIPKKKGLDSYIILNCSFLEVEC